ncbi:Docking domain of Afi1 for Arf3 in vesicle trafficking/Stabilization of polarity axis [Novymonas esmeraldas]|uniref:Docking domain of Afi1 for Arf3 in vesicle trafficking/Stabilization of polarity axis n=1 Tax=Novymonas esmeraldas TaxID=1808958 RepID=A0AAW0EQL6_9TRYP
MRRSPAVSVAATPLATCLIVAEFDIDTGACLRACYPRPLASPTAASPASAADAASPPGIAGHTEYFANVMLPDGAEKVSVTRTVFVVNRPHPPSYQRFPVYRFARASAPSRGGDSPVRDTPLQWERRPGEDTALYVSETLLINAVTDEVSLRYKDAELEAPCAVPMESISSLPSIPPEVLRFSRQLEAMLMNEASLSGSHTASFAAGAEPSAVDAGAATSNGVGGRVASLGTTTAMAGGGGGGSGGGIGGEYAFVVVDYTTAAAPRQEGYLMKVGHFERLLKTLTTLVQREKTRGPATPTPVSSTPEVDKADGGAAPPPPTRLRDTQAEGGPMDSVGSPSSMAPPGSSSGAGAASFDGVAGASGLPARFGGDGGGGSHSALSGGRSPVSPEPRRGGGADTPTATLSAEPSGHLVLPDMDGVSSDGDGDADFGGARHHVDASSAAAVAAAAAAAGAAAQPGRRASAAAAGGEASGPVLFGLCAVVSKRDSTARRGGITKSVAVLGPSLVWLEPFFPILVAAAQYCCDVNGTGESALRELQRILKRCYDSMNNAAGVVAAGRAKVDRLTAEIGKHCTLGSGQQAYVYYNDAPFGTAVKAKIPVSPESNDIVFTRYSLESVIESFGPSSLQLLLGILTEKKILILSRKGEAADVCEVALSLGIIGNLLDRNFMAQKVFPYVSVSSVDQFMQVPGYVVGTLNPIFDNVNPWGWDLLCDMDSKTVITAAERLLRKTTGTSSSAAGGNWSAATAGLANAVGVGGGGADSEALRALPPPLQHLYKELLSTIYRLRALRIGAVERNRRLRLILEDFLYTAVLVGYTAGGSVSVPSALYPTFAHRSLALLRSEMMLTAMMDNVRSHVLYPNENPALLLQCAALRRCAWGETPVHRTLQALLALLGTAYDVKLFLRRMTIAVGGLNAVGMQLTGPSIEARVAAADLLARVESVPEGKAAIASMNNFFLMIHENSVATASR